MLALQTLLTTTPTPELTPNLLPTRLSHTGPIKISKRYWNPTTTPPTPSNLTNDTNRISKTSYFRGRKLSSRTVKIPKGYTGYILCKTDTLLPPSTDKDDKSSDDQAEGERSRSDRLPVLTNKLPVFTAEGLDGDGEEDEDEDEDPLRRMMGMGTRQSAPNGAGRAGDKSGQEGGETEVKVLRVKGTFREMEIWGHEEVPSNENAFVKGLEEWMSFAEALHT